MGIQPKLTINTPGDVYEQEADRVAEQVMRMPEPRHSATSGYPERTADQNIHARVQTKRTQTNDAGGAAAPPIVHDVLRSPGQPLDAATRAFMEPRFGQDFSRVRVHADAKAADSARAIGAQAYTVGEDVVFGQGAFQIQSPQGRQLVAHELTHVIQQRGAAPVARRAVRVPIAMSTKPPSITAAPVSAQRAIPTSVVEHSESETGQKFLPIEKGLAGCERVDESVSAVKAENKWLAEPTNLTGHYFKQVRLIPGVTEVTGPQGGNTTSKNFCEQVEQLHPYSPYRGARWYMLAATVAHENVHASHMDQGLMDAAKFIKKDFNRVTIRDTPGMTAESALTALADRRGYTTAKNKMVKNWYDAMEHFRRDDERTNGPAAECPVLNQMRDKICRHAQVNDWGHCEACGNRCIIE